MKILKLRLRNLNSLYGEWEIDFQDPRYLNDGIFAISGPTGAGKSTILDAICLALFGETPRLGKISKNDNQIISRKTASCFAELEFIANNKAYRVTWQQRRAHNKVDTNLQDPQHEIADLSTGKIIESQRSKMHKVIEDCIGMDFERFTRASLLAQGGFDKFLKADIERKSKILEQITGTEIYSQISIATFERKRAEEDKLKQIQQRLETFDLLDDDALAQLEQDIHNKNETLRSASKTLNDLKSALQWRLSIEQLNAQLKNLEQERSELQQDEKRFAPDALRLRNAQKVRQLEASYTRLDHLRKEQNKDHETLADIIEDEQRQSKEAEIKQSALQNTEKACAEQKEHLAKSQHLFNEVRLLDHEIAIKNKALVALNDRLDGLASMLEAQAKNLETLSQKKANIQAQAKEAETYISEHQADAMLDSDLPLIRSHFENFQETSEQLASHKLQVEKQHAAKGSAQHALAQAKTALASATSDVKDNERALDHARQAHETSLNGRLYREYQSDLDHLKEKLLFARQIESLEQQRASLQQGQACPLCGATDHPFATSKPTKPEARQQEINELNAFIQTLDKQLVVMSDKEKALISAKSALTASESQHQLALVQLNNTKAQYDNLLKNQQTIEQKSQQQGLKLAQCLQVYFADLDQDNFLQGIKGLEQRHRQWINYKSQLDKFAHTINDLRTQIDQVAQAYTHQQQVYKEEQTSRDCMLEQMAQLKLTRHTKFTDRSVDEEENRLTQMLADTEQEHQIAHEALINIKRELASTQKLHAKIRQELNEREASLNDAKETFLFALAQSDFSDEQSYLANCLEPETIKHLEQQSASLSQRSAAIQTKQSEYNRQLEALESKALSELDLNSLQEKSDQQEASVRDLEKALNTLELSLQQDKQAKLAVVDHQKTLEKQQEVSKRWSKLADLIGSADGKKFRSFAQGLTFELMVSQANQHLQKMHQRYLLTRDPHSPLELNVIDNDQAGEIRTVKNLSGGESFIVSLALALGLSKMASQKLSIDSLFLDEGFGTLDEAALDTALNALASLHEENKLIGIISHVPALKERIATQIQIEPIREGRSKIIGPACQKISDS